MTWSTDEHTGKRFGKYEVLCRLAVGGMAEIFLAFARQGSIVGKPVVLKRILDEQREDPQSLQMLIDEARVTVNLSHPNVAQVIDLEMAGDDVLLVIEFIQGANLEEIVDVFKETKEVVPLGFALAVICEAAKGLGHAHLNKDAAGRLAPIIHRDVTPRNIMVTFEGTSKVLDFGIARAMGAQRRTVAGMVRGTTSYMSPEQAVGRDLDPRTDLFSLAAIFHELLVGQRLFFKGNPGAEMAAVYEGEIPVPSKVNRRVSKQLDTVVMRALERARERRYQSAADFVRDISAAAGSNTWARERCAEVVRERFASRRQDILRLLGRIPAQEPVSVSLIGRGAPAEPVFAEGQTVMAASPASPAGPVTDKAQAHDDGSEVGTMVQSNPPRDQPSVAWPSADKMGGMLPRRPSAPSLPGQTGGGRPPGGAGRPADAPIASGEQKVWTTTPTASLGSQAALPKVGSPPAAAKSAAPDKPPERSKEGAGSRLALLLAAAMAVVVSGSGGAFLYKEMQGPKPQPLETQLGRLSIAADRPVVVVFGGQVLGNTPLVDVWVPAGNHVFELREEDGTRRGLDIAVSSKESTKVQARLDTLRKLP